MNKNIEKLLKDAEHYIIISDKGLAINASAPAILTMITLATEQLIEDNKITKENIIEAVNNAGKDPRDVLAEMLKEFKDTLEDLKNSIEKEEE